MIPTPLSGFSDKPSFTSPTQQKALQQQQNDIKVVSIKINSQSSKRTSLASPYNETLRSALLSKKSSVVKPLSHHLPSKTGLLFKSSSSYSTSTPSTNSSRLTGSFHKPQQVNTTK